MTGDGLEQLNPVMVSHEPFGYPCRLELFDPSRVLLTILWPIVVLHCLQSLQERSTEDGNYVSPHMMYIYIDNITVISTKTLSATTDRAERERIHFLLRSISYQFG